MKPTPKSRVGIPSVARSGLSLLEMMLALGLSLLLMTGIYSALDTSARQATVGRAELQRLQLARALFRRIELDLRATMFDAESAVSDGSSDSSTESDTSSSSSGSSSGTSSSSGSSSSSSSGSSDSSSETVTVSSEDSEDEWTGSLGIRGSSTELWIDLSHISRDLEFTSLTPQSDMQTVAYFLTSSDSPLEQDPDAFLQIEDLDGVGLARSQGERSVLRTLNASSSGSVLPGPTRLLAPEVDLVQFRFFDGLAWYEEWDSSTIGSLPRAVEVTLGIDSAGGQINSTISPRIFRLVVAIPASDPLTDEESY